MAWKEKLAEIFVEITAKTGPLKTAMAKAEAIVKRTAVKMVSIIKRAAKYMSAAFLAIGYTIVKWSSDVKESEHLFEFAMGAMADETRKWSESLAKSLKRNQYEIRRTVATFQVMLTTMGVGAKEAAKMSQNLVTFSYDMAALRNLRPEEVFEKLKSGMVGFSRPMRALGISTTDTSLKLYALKHGIGELGKELTEQQKILIRYRIMMETATRVQGYAISEVDYAASVYKSLKAQIQLVAVAIGRRLLPQVTAVGIKIRDWIERSRELIAEKVGEWVDKLVPKLVEVTAKVKAWYDENEKLIKQKFDVYLTAVGDALIVFGKAAKAIRPWLREISYAIAAFVGLVVVAKIVKSIAVIGAAIKGLALLTKVVGVTIGTIIAKFFTGVTFKAFLTWLGASIAAMKIFGGKTLIVGKNIALIGKPLTYVSDKLLYVKGAMVKVAIAAGILKAAIIAMAAKSIWELGKLAKAWFGLRRAQKAAAETLEWYQKQRARRKEKAAEERWLKEEKSRIALMERAAKRRRGAVEEAAEEEEKATEDLRQEYVDRLELARDYYESMEGFEKELYDVRLKLMKLRAQDIAKELKISEAQALAGLVAREARERAEAAPMVEAAERAKVGFARFGDAWTQIASQLTGREKIDAMQLREQQLQTRYLKSISEDVKDIELEEGGFI